jgi:hypothetical protein
MRQSLPGTAGNGRDRTSHEGQAMSGLGWLGFTIAFLAPLPPERPERPHPPKRPEVQRLNERMACLLGAVAMLVAITPFFVAWGVRRTYDVYRVGGEA